MKLGFALPTHLRTSETSARQELARTAEAIGYDSLWSSERELFPADNPTSLSPFKQPVSFASMPEQSPLRALAEAAMTTERVDLRLSILNIPFHSPAMLAYHLSALDAISGGRVGLGIGLGATEDEHQAVVHALDGATPASEFVTALQAIWAGGTPEFRGEYFYTPYASHIAREAQTDRLPISLVACAPAAVLPSTILLGDQNEVISACVARTQLRGLLGELATSSQRARGRMPLVMRASINVTSQALGPDRPIFHGSFDQIQSDIAVAHAHGVTELIVDLNDSEDGQSVPRLQARMGQVYALAQRVMRGVAISA